MFNFQKILSKVCLLALTAILCVSLCTTSFAEDSFRLLYEETFEGESDGNISETLVKEKEGSFSAKIASEAVELKSDNLLYWRANSTTALNADVNVKGITSLNSLQKFTYYDEAVEFTDKNGETVAHHWTCNAGDPSARFGNIGGSDALHALTYWCTDADSRVGNERTNYYRFAVDPALIRSDDNDYKVTVEVYIPEYSATKQYIQFSYKSSGGTTKNVQLTPSSPEWAFDRWITWSFILEDADFTGKSHSYNATDWANFSITMPGYGSAIYNAQAYYRAVTLENISTDEREFAEKNNTVVLPVNTGDGYGDTRLSFDMTLPENETLTNTLKYNSGTNAMTIGIADEAGLDLATLHIDSFDDGQKIYAVSEDSLGEKTKNLLYSGNILDLALNYTLTIDWRARTYTVDISDGAEMLVQNEGPFDINNNSIVTGNALGRNVKITHSMYSQRMMCVIDNITFEVRDDASYITCKNEADAITLDTGDITDSNFTLPLVGETDGAVITWESDNEAIVVDNTLGTATVTCGGEKTEVILTATVNYDGVSYSREFVITVAEHTDSVMAREDASSIVLDIPASGNVKADFTLPSVGGNGSQITWESDDSDFIEISGNTAIVKRDAIDMPVTLTATVSCGEYSHIAEFNLIVVSFSDVYAVISAPVATEAGGKLDASVSVTYPALEGNLSFVAVSIDPATGVITDRKIDTQTVTPLNKYQTLTFNVTNLDKPAGNEVKYFLWDDSDISFGNNAPSPINNLKSKGKIKGISLSWDEAFDDNDAIEYYTIYRDGEYLGESTANYYLDDTAEKGKTYNYSVEAVDANELVGQNTAIRSDKMIESMYYIDIDKRGNGDRDYIYGMEDTVNQFLSDPARDLYAWVERVPDASGERHYAATTSVKSVSFKASASAITGTDKDLVIEFTYLDKEGSFSLTYNGIIPPGQSDSTTYARRTAITVNMTNTGEWKTAVARVNDANLRGGQYCAGMHFQFWGGSAPNNMFIREFKVIQAEHYD